MSNVFKNSQYGFAISALQPNQGMVKLGESYFPMGTASESVVVYTCDEEEMPGVMSSLGMVTEFVAPSTLKAINGGVFAQQNHLKKVVLPSSVKSIYGEAFAECSELNDINLNAVEEIHEAAFVLCTSLAQVHLDSVKIIGSSAFSECSNLTVYLNDNVEEVQDANAFVGIAHLYYHGSLEGAPWGATAWN